MKVLKIVLIGIGCVIVLIGIALGAYKLLYSQGVAESFEVNSPELKQKVLIATQGSTFKDTLVAGLTEHLEQKPVYIKGVDVSALPEVNEDGWNAVVLIHACESGKLQPDVEKYLGRAKNLNKVVLLTTSGSGTWKTEDFNIDTITTASKKDRVSSLVTDVLTRLDGILGTT